MKRKLASIILVGALIASLGALAGFDNSGFETKEESKSDKEEERADREEDKAETEEEKAETAEEEGREKAEDKDDEKVAEDEEKAEADESKAGESDNPTVTIYAAENLQTVMEDLISEYNESQPDVEIVGNYGSSDTLLKQIEEVNGDGIDIFFPAAQSQMDMLQNNDHLVVDDTRHNVLNNQVCLITYTDSGTEAADLETLDKAESLAIADGSVPIGEYTRQALVNAKILPEVEDVSTINTEEISDVLEGVEINECGDVSKVLQAVAEKSNECGTAYYADTYGYEDQIEILQVIGNDLTGDVIYPIAQVANPSADEIESEAALDFINFIMSDDAKDIFVEYYFDVDVTDD